MVGGEEKAGRDAGKSEKTRLRVEESQTRSKERTDRDDGSCSTDACQEFLL